MHNRVGPGGDVVRAVACATGSCSCRWCCASWPSRCSPSRRSSTPSGRSRRRCSRCCRPRAADGGEACGEAAMISLVAQAKITGPEIDWNGALAGRRARRRRVPRAARRARARAVHPRAGRAGADARDPGRDRRAGRVAVGRERVDHRGRARDGRPHARADDDLRGRRGRRGGAVVALAGGGGGGRGRVLRAAADLRAGHGHPGRGAELRRALPRLRAAVDPALRAVRDAHPARALARVGPEVPDHRLRRVGDAALRPVADLRRDGLDRLRRRRGRRRRRGATTRCSSPASRSCSRGSRSRPRWRRSTSGRRTSTRARRRP